MTNPLSRRDALKTVGFGVTTLGLAGATLAQAAKPASAEHQHKEQQAPQPFVLPALGYAYDALEPHIDARTMEIHHTKHHQAYIDQANRHLAEYPDLLRRSGEQLLCEVNTLPEAVRGVVRNHVGGHLNHSLFWRVLSPKPRRIPQGELRKVLEKSYGSFDAFKERLLQTAMTRFGSGWAWLSLSHDGRLELHSTANQDSPLMLGAVPLLGIDVWEHAYYLKYQNLRKDYVLAVMDLIDWGAVEETYALHRPK